MKRYDQFIIEPCCKNLNTLNTLLLNPEGLKINASCTPETSSCTEILFDGKIHTYLVSHKISAQEPFLSKYLKTQINLNKPPYFLRTSESPLIDWIQEESDGFCSEMNELIHFIYIVEKSMIEVVAEYTPTISHKAHQ